MAPWKSSNFLDALTSQPVGRDACDVGQSVGCSMAIVTRYDFDCVHEMNFPDQRGKSKEQKKRKEHLREGAEEKKREKEKRRKEEEPFF